MDRLDKIEKSLEKVQSDVTDLRAKDIPQILIAVAELRVKAGIWGGLAGVIGVVVAILLQLL